MRLTRDTHLHSREHLLADDLSRAMGEPRRFASYLGIAKMYDESDLRALAKRVLEKSDVDPRNRGKYFFGSLRGLVKTKRWHPKRLPRVKKKKRTQQHHAKTNHRRTA